MITNPFMNQISILIQQQLSPIQVSINNIENRLLKLENQVKDVESRSIKEVRSLLETRFLVESHSVVETLSLIEIASKERQEEGSLRGNKLDELSNSFYKIEQVIELIIKCIGELSIVKNKMISTEKADTFGPSMELSSKIEEYRMFDYVSVEQLVDYFESGSNLVVFTHWSQIYNEIIPNAKFIKPMSMGNLISINAEKKYDNIIACHPSALLEYVNQTDEMLICSPLISTYILNSGLVDSLLEVVSERVVLPFFIQTAPVLVNWEYGFSVVEYGDEVFRWVDSLDKKAFMTVYNNTNDSISFRMDWKSYSLGTSENRLQVFGCGLNKLYNLNEQNAFSEIITIIPGQNELHFNYLGDSVIPAEGSRNLSFCLIGFSLTGLGNNINLSGEEIYQQTAIQREYLISDAKIRNVLHANGFFEVSGKAFYNKGHYEAALPISRYFHATNDYYYLDEVADPIQSAFEEGLSTLLVVYTAERSVKRGLQG
ncbi:hypothetical protein [Paenibacillus sp. FSL H8-0034]|uniref:hypothetical protein n=1 Tax=Paenibacillus sp. FSL H8-0034 TaxID=2954671 RepID=UPI0030F9D8B8